MISKVLAPTQHDIRLVNGICGSWFIILKHICDGLLCYPCTKTIWFIGDCGWIHWVFMSVIIFYWILQHALMSPDASHCLLTIWTNPLLNNVEF